MVGIGMIMIALGLTGAVLWFRGSLYTNRLFLKAMQYAGSAARLSRRAVRLVCRRSRPPALDRVRPVAHGGLHLASTRRQRILLTRILFVLAYGVVFGAGVYYIAMLVRAGPEATPPVPEEGEADLSHRPMAAAGNP